LICDKKKKPLLVGLFLDIHHVTLNTPNIWVNSPFLSLLTEVCSHYIIILQGLNSFIMTRSNPLSKYIEFLWHIKIGIITVKRLKP